MMLKTSAFYIVILTALLGVSPLSAEPMSEAAYRRKEKGFQEWTQRREASNAERLKTSDAQKQKRRDYEERLERARASFKRPIYGNDHLLPEYLKKVENRDADRKKQEQAFAEISRAARQLYEEIAVPMKNREYGIEKAP
ncbi:MAG: hypothetical protein K2Q26_05675 [Bdellovibrionales bacterium]|nr:hypothetical protein [Bdellovibrionales bacterium]